MDSERFAQEWVRCSPWIEAALEHCNGTHRIEDVAQLVLTDPDTAFWPGQRSAIVAQLSRHPRLIQLHLWLCGGDLRELLDMLPTIEAHGVLHGATMFTTGGRLKNGKSGWGRVLKSRGYAPRWEICVKDLTT